MSKVNIKITGTDPFSKLVLVSCNTDQSIKSIDEQPSYGYAPDFGGASTPEEFLINVQASCQATALRQDAEEARSFDVEGFEGKTLSFDPDLTDIPALQAEYEAAKQEVFNQWAPANQDVVNELCGTAWTNIQLAPLTRERDAAIIGVYVNGYGGQTIADAALAFKSIKEVTDKCIELGVLMGGGTLPSTGMTRERFVEYLTSISPNNKFLEDGWLGGYVYQEYTVDYARNRKRTLINSDRNREIASGTTFAGFEWDSSATSRNNLSNFITATGNTTGVWRTKDNQNVSVDLVGLSKAFTTHVTACFEKSWARKEALKATTSFGEVDAI